MSFEVDIRAVGENTNSGDAIAIRYGAFSQNPDSQRVVVIDGGYQANGEDLVRLITNVYHTNRVDLLISTHPHDDHVNGLVPVFENLHVDALWMHRPWEHADSVRAYVRERRVTTQTFSARLQRSLDSAYALEQIAIKKGITPVEPFAGTTFDGKFAVIGPTSEYYEALVCDFGESTSGLGRLAHLLESIPEKASQLRRRIAEDIAEEDQLVEPAEGDVSARNNSSAIIVGILDDKEFLFTADAGVPALTRAADYAKSKGHSLSQSVTHPQIPHHGSKRNLGPVILNRIIGMPRQLSVKQAFVSASREWDTKHPSMRVTNALHRRGAKVYGTRGKHLYFHSADLPIRANWESAKEIPFAPEYEEED